MDDFTEPAYEVTIRVPADGPIPTEDDLRRALLSGLSEEFPQMWAFVARL